MKNLLFFTALLCAVNVSRAQWEPEVRLTSNAAFSYTSYSNANCIAAKGDTLHIVWYDNRDGNSEIYYKSSTDGGVSWGADKRLTNNTERSYDPSVLISGTVVHVTWTDARNENDEIYYKQSTDGGLTWGPDVRLTNAPLVSESSSMAISDSVIHLVWFDERDDPTGNWYTQIYYKRSTDGGLNWGEDTRITNTIQYAGYPSVALSGSVVHVAWEDYRDGNGEIYYKRSTDGGLTWEADIRMTNEPADSWDPILAVNGDNVHMVWMDLCDGGAYEVYYNRSTDGGLTWGTNTRLTNAAAPSEYPTIAVSGSNVHVVWGDQRDMNYEVYYKCSENSGLSWGPDTRLSNAFGRSDAPFITVSGSAIHVIWEENRDGNFEIYYKRNLTGNFYTGIGNDLVNGSGQQFSIYPNPASTSIHIDFENYSDKTATLSIRNILGEEIYTRQIRNKETLIDVSSLQTGIYFVGIKTGNTQSISTKLIIQN